MADGKCQMADGKCQMADGKCQMAEDEWQMANDECQVAEGEPQEAGGCDEGQSSEPMTEGWAGLVVGYDSNRVIDDSANDKMGILSHEGTDATDRPYQGAGDRQSLPAGVKTRENVQNEANPETTQNSLPLEVESYSAEPAGPKRSQFTQAVAREQ